MEDRGWRMEDGGWERGEGRGGVAHTPLGREVRFVVIPGTGSLLPVRFF
jgi:hypothetical protein